MAKLMLVAVAALAFGRAADEDLDKAAAKAAEMGNYSCTITVKVEGGGGGGGGGEGRAPQPVEIQIKADAPWHLKSGEIEAYKKGDALAVKEGDAWKLLGRPQRPAEGEQPDRKAMAAQMLRGVRAPHELLKDLKSASFKEVKREDGEGGRIFSGELTAEGVKPFMMGNRRRGGGGDQAAPAGTGTAKIWVNGDGVVTKYEVNVESKRKNRDGEEVTTKSTRTVEIKDVGSTKYDLPEGVAKVFESKTAEK